ncbi:dirigent protein 22-like [Tripterygium wilfordii]|uniref:Dirigent protein n=1 Tax=Tripterygium wilfordii TaxID=458696 RepID=A0A7J7BUA6_TRIWF|nr:dirigent protein 22-like [Tripterygium wilfordii]KAF5725509.1 dirigent protein 22-like [Tripterygium wilfordii]
MGSIISSKLATQFIASYLVCSFAVVLVTGDEPGFVRTMNRELIGLNYEQFSHIHVYWHDIVSGPRPTSVPIVAPSSNTSVAGFGFVSMIDDPLTEGPQLGSKLVGRAQGFYASASQQEVGLLMVMNFAFMEGKYNGSTISILGRNTVFSKVREMPVIGGSGVFRFARGYVQARTYRFDVNTGDAVVEYNIYVSHY